MDDETIRLILDLGGSAASVQQVRDALEALKGTVTSTAQGYGVLERQVGTYEVDTARVSHELDDQVRKAVEATSAQRALARALDESGGPAQGFTQRLGRMGNGLAGASYGLQDVITVLSMGGGWDRALASATNNITPMLIGLGLGGGLAGVAGLAVTAVIALGPALSGLGIKLDQSVKAKIPEATDRIEGLTAAIKRDKEAVEELTRKRELDYFEMQRYTEQVDRLRKAEHDLDTARKARSIAGVGAGQRERAGAFRAAAEKYGGSEAVIGALQEQGMGLKEAERLVADAVDGARNAVEVINRTLANVRGFQYTSPETTRRRRRQAEQTEAALRGNAEARREADEARREADEAKREDKVARDQQAEIDAGMARRDEEGRGDAGPRRRRRAGGPAFDMRKALREQDEGMAAQRRILAATGFHVQDPAQAAAIVKGQQEALRRAQAQGMSAMLNAMGGNQREIAMWQQFTREVNFRMQQMQGPTRQQMQPMGTMSFIN